MQTEQEKTIELQNRIIEQLEARVTAQEETIRELRALVGELRQLKANLEETIAEFSRQLFGTKSEKTSVRGEAAEIPEPVDETMEGQAEGAAVVKEYTRGRGKKSTRAEMYADLPVREVQCPLPDEDKFCPYCNAPMDFLGYKTVREEIRITPAKVERIRYIQESYICPECRSDGDGTIVQSAAPTPLLPHSPASPSAVAYIMYQKNFVQTPYYRQEACMSQLGLPLPRETMANWYICCALEYFLPVYDRMHELILLRDVIHADETVCQVLHEEGKTPESTSYMWIYLSGSDGLPPVVLYDYQPGRGGDYPKSFLAGFSGMVQCDGYSGYNSVEDVILVCCVAHCRRKFFEALPPDRKKVLKLLDIRSEENIRNPGIPTPEEMETLPPAEIGMKFCNQLFFLEKGLKGMGPDERKSKRQELEAPVWDGFWEWVGTLDPLGGSKLEKAVNYALNHKQTLCNYMLDGRLELSNNAAERKAKTYAIGRKNFLFHNSVRGARASAVVYSIVETARANKINVFQYLYTLLLYMPDYKDDTDAIELLLPWSDFIKEQCSGLIDTESNVAEKRIPLPMPKTTKTKS